MEFFVCTLIGEERVSRSRSTQPHNVIRRPNRRLLMHCDTSSLQMPRSSRRSWWRKNREYKKTPACGRSVPPPLKVLSRPCLSNSFPALSSASHLLSLPPIPRSLNSFAHDPMIPHWHTTVFTLRRTIRELAFPMPLSFLMPRKRSEVLSSMPRPTSRPINITSTLTRLLLLAQPSSSGMLRF